ncbi:hypothetical protein AOLI_G00125770 [Acnodon oligacanthus]
MRPGTERLRVVLVQKVKDVVSRLCFAASGISLELLSCEAVCGITALLLSHVTLPVRLASPERDHQQAVKKAFRLG